MKKKILAIMLCFVFLFNVFPFGTIVNAESPAVTYKVKTENKKYYPGDVIDFEVTLQQTTTLSIVEMKIRIPEGLTLIESSGNTDSGKAVLGWNDLEFLKPSEANGIVGIMGQTNLSGSDQPYTGTSEVTIGTFQCKVNENAVAKNYNIELYELAAADATPKEITNVTPISAQITVEPKPVPATSVTLNKENLALNAGENETLVATLGPVGTTDTVKEWKSSNTAVATVDNTGKVIAVSKGSATITVTTTNNLTKTCIVTVECLHANKTSTAEKASTCKVQGNIAYDTCNACGAIFNSSNTQITLEDTKLPLAEHTYGNEIAEVPTTHTNKTATAGTKAHFECTVCNKLFLEVNGQKVETTAEEIVIPAPKHTYSDWKTDGSNHWKECTVCGLETEKTAHKSGTSTKENIVDATCTVEGSYEEVTKCTICNKELNRTTKTEPAKGHTAKKAVRENVVDATCTAEGSYDEVIYCKDCNTEMSRVQKTIEKLPHQGAGWNSDADNHWKTCQSVGCGTIIDRGAHTVGESVKEKIKPATCTVEGSYEEVTYCTVCNKELSRTPKTEPAKGHIAGEPVKENQKLATCEEKGIYEEVIYCTVCNKELSRTPKTEPAKGHTAGEAVKENEKPATTKKEGSYDEVVYCVNCDKELSREKKTTPKFVYEMLEGMDGEYKYEDKEGLTFKSNGDIDKFLGIKVDGKTVEYGNYTAIAGSTIVNLKPEYLDTLSEGKHTLTLAYEDGEVETEFTVDSKEQENNNSEDNGNKENNNGNNNSGDNGNEENNNGNNNSEGNDNRDNNSEDNNNKNTNKDNPKTGDNSNIILWVSGLLVSGICFIVVLKWKTKSQRIKAARH